MVTLAREGGLAPLLAPLGQDPSLARGSALGGAFEQPDQVPAAAWREYIAPVAGDAERARYTEKIIAGLEPGQLAGVNDRLAGLQVPVQLVWGTGDGPFGVQWAYKLRDLIPRCRVIEVDGAKMGPLTAAQPGPGDSSRRRHLAGGPAAIRAGGAPSPQPGRGAKACGRDAGAAACGRARAGGRGPGRGLDAPRCRRAGHRGRVAVPVRADP